MNTSVRFPNLDIDFGFVGRSVSVFGFELTFFGLLTAAGMLLGLAGGRYCQYGISDSADNSSVGKLF